MSSIKKAVASILMALALLAAPVNFQPVNATILFAGGEDIDFTFIGGPQSSTGAGTFRSGYARLSIDPTDGTTSDPPVSRFFTPVFTATTSLWLHMEVYTTTVSTDSGAEMVCAIDPSGVCRLMFRGTGSTSIKLTTRTSAGVLVDLMTCTSGGWPINGIISKIDWKLNYNSSGSSDLYVNGVDICSYSGNVTTESATQIAQYYFGRPSRGSQSNYSEIIVATTSTRDLNLATCAPQANGTTQNWTGTAANVNPTTVNDTSAITTTSTGTIGNFTCPALPTGAFTVPAVVQSARIQGANSITNFRFNSRPAGAGSDFDTTADIPVTSVFTSYPNNIITTNPNTSGAWTTSVLGSSSNFGVKSRP